MQVQSPNPFPMSDDKPTAPPAPVPMPQALPVQPAGPSKPPGNPIKPPTQSVFVQPTAPNMHQSSVKPTGPTATLENILVSLFSKPAIQLPDYMRDMTARMLPYLTIMMSVIVAPLVVVGLAMGGFMGFLTSFYDINTNPFYWITIVLLITQLSLMIAAVPRLLRESRRGWYLLFLAALLGVLTLITNIFAQFVAPIVALLVGLAAFVLILYVLFQTRSYYTN